MRVASSLADMNNFNTMMAILGAINSTPIKRLKRTWDEVSVCVSVCVGENGGHIRTTKGRGYIYWIP